MMKYILFFIAAYFGGNSNVLAQSQLSTKQGESSFVSDTSKSEISHGTITRAGKNQQSIYTPSTNEEPIHLHQESGFTLAIPAKTQPAIIDPKKK